MRGSLRLLGPFNPFRSRSEFPCGARLCLNVYVGCAHGCRYCYGQAYVPRFSEPRPKPRFERLLRHDLEAMRGWLPRPWVSVSNSTDPLQPLEARCGHTLLALRLLAAERFPLLVVTKNPAPLCRLPYLRALGQTEAVVHVSVAFARPSPLEPGAPPPAGRIAAMRRLTRAGLEVRARIDPLIPPVGGLGQTPGELRELVLRLAEAGVRGVYAKCLRLMGGLRRLQPELYRALLPAYRARGEWRARGWHLRPEAKRELLEPVWEAAQEAGLRLFTCTDAVDLPGVGRCELSGEGG